jgi:hypothetical protein
MEAIAQVLYAYLMTNQPLNARVCDMALTIGVTDSQLNNVLWWIRKPEIVAWHGWTIPWQPRGTAAKQWQVVEVSGMTVDQLAALHGSDGDYRGMCARMLLRDKALIDVAISNTNGRTREGREYRRVSRMLDGAAAMLGS